MAAAAGVGGEGANPAILLIHSEMSDAHINYFGIRINVSMQHNDE